jgi:hypothetical protein
VLAVEEFQNWRSGAFTNGASVTASGMTYAFQTYADRYTGFAVANPSEYVIRCSGTLTDNIGNILGTKSFTLSGRGQTSFGVGDAFNLSSTSPTSYLLTCTWTNTTINPAPAPFSALAIAGDSRGITSSMPTGDFAMPGSSYRLAWNAFYHLVKAFNSKSGFEVGQPVVRLLNDPIINATYDSANNIVTVNLALIELLADSPSEVAYVIAHALGHAHQRLAGNNFDPNVELDADQFSLFGLLFTGYDTYAAAGALGKLAVASEQSGLVSPLFDNLHEDPHKSFTTRMGLIMGESQTVCGLPQAADLCGMQQSLFHIHMPR